MNNMLLKQDFTSSDLQMLNSEMTKKKKSTGTAWLLWLFLGGIGGHRYYLGKTGTAIIMTLTLGGLGLWTLIDLFLLSGMIRKTNESVELNIIEDIRMLKSSKANDAQANRDLSSVSVNN